MAETYYACRISPNSQRPSSDFQRFEQTLPNQELLWDKDYYNKMKIGDSLMFILGAGHAERIRIYPVIGERPVGYRLEQWNYPGGYTNPEGNSVTHREVVVLSRHYTESPYTWAEWKVHNDYKPNYWPQGTKPVKRILK